MSKTAIITGILGQDGSFLADLLLASGVEVHGVYRRISTGNNLDNLADAYGHSNLNLIEMDIADHVAMSSLINRLQPDYLFNLAAQSHVGYSFDIPIETFKVNAEAVMAQLHAIKMFSPTTRYYQASTSEMMGTSKMPEAGYNELSRFHPRSPYGVAKLAAYHAVVNYREAYDIFACNGILFNHSSKRRGRDFATRKITLGVAAIVSGHATKLKMGNLEARRDEGHAKDYVLAMYKMLQVDKPWDYVVSTGVSVSIREMLEYVCSLAGLNIDDVYEKDERYMRPSDIPDLKGDSRLIRGALDWEPKYDWKMLLKEMYENDLKNAMDGE